MVIVLVCIVLTVSDLVVDNDSDQVGEFDESLGASSGGWPEHLREVDGRCEAMLDMSQLAFESQNERKATPDTEPLPDWWAPDAE